MDTSKEVDQDIKEKISDNVKISHDFQNHYINNIRNEEKLYNVTSITTNLTDQISKLNTNNEEDIYVGICKIISDTLFNYLSTNAFPLHNGESLVLSYEGKLQPTKISNPDKNNILDDAIKQNLIHDPSKYTQGNLNQMFKEISEKIKPQNKEQVKDIIIKYLSLITDNIEKTSTFIKNDKEKKEQDEKDINAKLKEIENNKSSQSSEKLEKKEIDKLSKELKSLSDIIQKDDDILYQNDLILKLIKTIQCPIDSIESKTKAFDIVKIANSDKSKKTKKTDLQGSITDISKESENDTLIENNIKIINNAIREDFQNKYKDHNFLLSLALSFNISENDSLKAKFNEYSNRFSKKTEYNDKWIKEFTKGSQIGNNAMKELLKNPELLEEFASYFREFLKLYTNYKDKIDVISVNENSETKNKRSEIFNEKYNIELKRIESEKNFQEYEKTFQEIKRIIEKYNQNKLNGNTENGYLLTAKKDISKLIKKINPNQISLDKQRSILQLKIKQLETQDSTDTDRINQLKAELEYLNKSKAEQNNNEQSIEEIYQIIENTSKLIEEEKELINELSSEIDKKSEKIDLEEILVTINGENKISFGDIILFMNSENGNILKNKLASTKTLNIIKNSNPKNLNPKTISEENLEKLEKFTDKSYNEENIPLIPELVKSKKINQKDKIEICNNTATLSSLAKTQAQYDSTPAEKWYSVKNCKKYGSTILKWLSAIPLIGAATSFSLAIFFGVSISDKIDEIKDEKIDIDDNIKTLENKINEDNIKINNLGAKIKNTDIEIEKLNNQAMNISGEKINYKVDTRTGVTTATVTSDQKALNQKAELENQIYNLRSEQDKEKIDLIALQKDTKNDNAAHSDLLSQSANLEEELHNQREGRIIATTTNAGLTALNLAAAGGLLLAANGIDKNIKNEEDKKIIENYKKNHNYSTKDNKIRLENIIKEDEIISRNPLIKEDNTKVRSVKTAVHKGKIDGNRKLINEEEIQNLENNETQITGS